MTAHYWDPQSVNGDAAQRVDYPVMRVGHAGELAFYDDGDPLFAAPAFVVAPGEWKAAWREED